jgi:hypothetical protein
MAILIFNVEAVRIANKMYANQSLCEQTSRTDRKKQRLCLVCYHFDALALFEWFLSYCSSERSVAISFAAIAVRI